MAVSMGDPKLYENSDGLSRDFARVRVEYGAVGETPGSETLGI
jgi:hypothetical protein